MRGVLCELDKVHDMGVSQYPIHELINRGETDVIFYRGIANAWALNFLFSDYRLYPNPMGYVYQTYRYSYPSERVQAVKEWLGRPEGADAFASVLDDSLTREKAEITNVYFNSTGIASGLEIALLQYFRYRVHVSIISADRRAVLADLLVRFDNNYNTDNMSSAVRDVSRYNWFMPLQLLYAEETRPLNLRDLERRYAFMPRKWRELDITRDHYQKVSKLIASGYQALGMSIADVQEAMLIMTRTDAYRALPLYSLLRALYKTDNPMAFYAIKAMVR